MDGFAAEQLELSPSLSLRKALPEVPGSAFLSAGLKEKKTMEKRSPIPAGWRRAAELLTGLS